MLKILNKIRRQCYSLGSLLGDVNAVASLNPEKIAKRYIRKQSYKGFGGFINKLLK